MPDRDSSTPAAQPRRYRITDGETHFSLALTEDQFYLLIGAQALGPAAIAAAVEAIWTEGRR